MAVRQGIEVLDGHRVCHLLLLLLAPLILLGDLSWHPIAAHFLKINPEKVTDVAIQKEYLKIYHLTDRTNMVLVLPRRMIRR